MNKQTQQEKQLSDVLMKFSLTHTCPIYFGDPLNDKIKLNNGTVTLVSYNGNKYGLTNHHVISCFRERLEKEDIELYIGNKKIDLEKNLIDEDEALDLCTILLNEYAEDNFKPFGKIQTCFFEIENFSIGQLKKGDLVLFGGYPGDWRSQPERNIIIFDTFSSDGTEISDITNANICCTLAIDKCFVNLNLELHDTLPDNLGGISGGAVFSHCLTDSGISQFKLIGIIYEYSKGLDALLIRPINLINSDFSIKKNIF